MIYFILFVVILLILKFNHFRIKWKTFTKKGFKVEKGRYGVYCYCGKQGSGKTYSVVEHILYEMPKKYKIVRKHENYKWC